MKQIIFTHIHKTAGSSFVSTVVAPNVPQEKIYRQRSHQNLRDLFRKARHADFVSGHIPYGAHLLTARQSHYMTFLRDPVDRAVSWYYWIKDLDRTDLYRRHPLRNYADSVSIKEFYENPLHANTQARFVAGMLHDNLYPKIRTRAYHARVLEVAKRNLDRFACFGIQERFEESVRLIMQTFGWTERAIMERRRSTNNRPTVAELNSLDPRIADELRQYNSLDQELYEYALERFDDRLKQAGLTSAPDAIPATVRVENDT